MNHFLINIYSFHSPLILSYICAFTFHKISFSNFYISSSHTHTHLDVWIYFEDIAQDICNVIFVHYYRPDCNLILRAEFVRL